jgi:hypothetical protein
MNLLEVLLQIDSFPPWVCSSWFVPNENLGFVPAGLFRMKILKIYTSIIALGLRLSSQKSLFSFSGEHRTIDPKSEASLHSEPWIG